jgi:hypothetical protein
LPCALTGLGGQRPRPDDEQAAGQAAARWPAAARSAAGRRENPHTQRPSSSRLAAGALAAGQLICGASSAICAVQSASRAAGHVPLSSRRYPQRGALTTTPAGLITAQAPQRSGEARSAVGCWPSRGLRDHGTSRSGGPAPGASVLVDPVLPEPRREPALLQARRRSSRPRVGSVCPDTDAAYLAATACSDTTDSGRDDSHSNLFPQMPQAHDPVHDSLRRSPDANGVSLQTVTARRLRDTRYPPFWTANEP